VAEVALVQQLEHQTLVRQRLMPWHASFDARAIDADGLAQGYDLLQEGPESRH
jgi:hypothetical protein